MPTNINAAKRYKDIPLPFICPLSNRKFDSTKGIAIYVSKTLKMDHKEYYDKYIYHRDKLCFFCYNEGLFMSVGKGYRNLCSSQECLKKSFVSHSVEGIMYREMISREDAEIRFNQENSKQLENRMKTFEEKRTEDKDWDKKRSRNNKLFWIEKGLTEEDSKKKAYESMKDIHKKTSEKKKSNPEFYKDSYTTNIEYYLKRGFDKEEGEKLLKERQTTFSLEICIEKYGDEIGEKIWIDRQEKWQNSLAANGNIKGGYSKISQELFNEITKIYDDSEIDNIFYWTKNKEYFISSEKSFLLYDFTDFKNKKIIEYNGDQYHGNPKIYNENDLPHPYNKSKGFTAKCLWEKDKIKIDIAKNKGFDVLTIWDSEYKKNKEATIKKCINFLKYDKTNGI
jgi:hypothetical protein